MSARVGRALRRLATAKNRGAAVAQVLNKTAFAHAARAVVDVVHASRRRDRRSVPALANDVESRNLQQLRTQGWTRLPDAWGEPQRVEAARFIEDLQARFDRTGAQIPERYKTIWNYLSDQLAAEGPLDESNPLVRLALIPAVVRIVANYVDEIPWLRYTLVTESVYQPGEPEYSQKWHLDFDDKRMVKLFGYFTDVRDADDGPFELIESADSARVRNAFVPAHLSDDQVFSSIPRSAVRPVLGPKLTMFIADTHRVYHCGSRMAQGHSRLLYTALYTAFPSIYPGGKNAFKAGSSASELERLILCPY